MRNIRKKIFQLFDKNEKKQYTILMFLSIIGAFLDMLGISLTIPLIYSLIGANEDSSLQSFIRNIIPNLNVNQYLVIIIIFMIIVFVFKNLFLSLELYAQSNFTNKCKKKVKKQLYDSFLYKPYEKLLKYPSGKVINTLTTDCDGVFMLIYRYLIMRTELVVVFVIFIYLLILDYKMSLILIITIVLEIMLISKIIEPIIKNKSRENYKYNTQASNWINQTFSGIKEVKVSSKINFFSQKFKNYSDILSDTQTMADFLTSLPRNIIEAVTISCMLLYIFVFIRTGNDNILLISHLSAFAAAAIRLLPSFNRITNARNVIAYNEKRLDNIIDCLDEDKIYGTSKNNNESVTLNDCLKINDISFKYSDRNDYVIENGNLEIKYGSMIGIVGPSGVGKTTLVDILLGLLMPQKGIILSDDKNIYDCYDSWISSISYIPQDIFIINSTIKENIGFGINNEEIDDDRVIQTLKISKLYEFVMSLPNGINTIIDEKGMDLSGGQKQRIGIARALYNDPHIIIFDEATSSLDNETEKEIMESINQLHHKKTIIIISHRSSTLEYCDIIYRIENKTIYREK